MQYKESNLLGAPFRGGALAWGSPTQLLVPLGSRVAVTDLHLSQSNTLPGQHSGAVARMAVSPDGALLLSVDARGRALLVNVRRRRLLHRMTFKDRVRALKFSPDGALFAVGVGKLVQVWRTPGFRKQFAAFQLLTTGACHDIVSSLDWSPDGDWILAGCRDLCSRLFCIHRLHAFHRVTLGGHRDAIVGVFFTGDRAAKTAADGAYTVSRDGALFTWKFHPPPPESEFSHPLADSQNELQPPAGGVVSVGDPLRLSKNDSEKAVEDQEEEEEFTLILNSPESMPGKGENGSKRSADESLKHKEKRLKTNVGGASVNDSNANNHDERNGAETGEEGRGVTNYDPSELDDGGFGEVVNGTNSGDEEDQARRSAYEVSRLRRRSCARLDKGRWELVKKDFFLQKAKVTTCDFHPGLNLLVAGFSSGTFGLYQLPEFTCLHLLSISREKITSAAFNESGNWLAFGSAKLGQLLVWEWRSETYILKQQGHYFDVNCVAYSPDSQLLVTGADDNKLKVSLCLWFGVRMLKTQNASLFVMYVKESRL